MSPSYPSNYPMNVRCRWTLVTNRFDKIRIRFSDFDVEPSTGCTKDRVTIEDVNPSVAPKNYVQDYKARVACSLIDIIETVLFTLRACAQCRHSNRS